MNEWMNDKTLNKNRTNYKHLKGSEYHKTLLFLLKFNLNCYRYFLVMWKGTIDGYKTNEIILQMNNLSKSDISTYKYTYK